MTMISNQSSMPSPEDIRDTVTRALIEDIGSGDLTAALIPANAEASATVISRESAIICGSAWFDCAFQLVEPQVRIDWHVKDGDSVKPTQLLCTLCGPARGLLTGERTALNFLQTLSGTATRARQFADAVAGTTVRVLDTRKTLPGLRSAQKYAVRCGGGYNHRMGLYDAVLIKENHIAAAGSIAKAVTSARHLVDDEMIEVEVENLDEFQQALDADVDVILLDNFDLDDLARAVHLNHGRAKLEASGGINLANIRAVAETGVDYISIGGITKDVRAVDLSMRFSAHPTSHG